MKARDRRTDVEWNLCRGGRVYGVSARMEMLTNRVRLTFPFLLNLRYFSLFDPRSQSSDFPPQATECKPTLRLPLVSLSQDLCLNSYHRNPQAGLDAMH